MRLRHKLILGASVLSLALGIGALLDPKVRAQVPGASVITSLTGSEYLANLNSTLGNVFSTNTLASFVRGTELLFTLTQASATTTGTTEQTLAGYVMPANTLLAGSTLEIYASFSAAANGNNKTFKCYFGSESISSGVLTTNAKNGFCRLIVAQYGTASQIVSGEMQVDTTNITASETAAVEPTTAPMNIWFGATDGSSSAGDIRLNQLIVKRVGQ